MMPRRCASFGRVSVARGNAHTTFNGLRAAGGGDCHVGCGLTHRAHIMQKIFTSFGYQKVYVNSHLDILTVKVLILVENIANLNRRAKP